MLAEGSSGSRTAQKMVMAGIAHERRTDPELGKLLDTVEGGQGGLDETQAAVLREARRKCAPAA